MGRHNTVSGILVLIVVLMIAATAFMVISYANGVISAALAFASTDQIAKMQACGIAAPAELSKLRADLPNVLLPAIYVGFPVLMIMLSILMFFAGYFHGEKEGHSSSETTTTISSPNRNHGKYASGRHVEKTRTEKSSRSEGT